MKNLKTFNDINESVPENRVATNLTLALKKLAEGAKDDKITAEEFENACMFVKDMVFK